MYDADRHPAAAENGPLANQNNLTVPQQYGERVWPRTVVWPTPRGKRHLYGLMAVDVGPGFAQCPLYAFLRTLGSKESEPEIEWVLPPRYLM